MVYQSANPRTSQYRLGFIIEQALGHRTHAQNLRKILAGETGLDIHWILPEAEKSGLAAHIPVYSTNWTVQAGLQTRMALSRTNRRCRLDGLFFHTQVTAVLSPDWVRRFPSVVSLDATPIQYDALGEAYSHAPGPAWLERRKYALNKGCFHAARRLVTWSAWTRDSLIADYGVPAEKITVIPPGVDTAAWQRPDAAQHDPRTVKTLFVGGNLDRKGGRELIDAFTAIRSSELGRRFNLELHLVTLDDGPDQPGVIYHHGLKPNTPELKQLYFEADIFCLPTHGDCLPMVIAEAGAAGLPVISTQLAGIPELVQPEVNGYLIKPGDVRGLIDALSSLMGDPARRAAMGAESRRIVTGGHDVERNAHELVSLLTEVIDTARRERAGR